MKALPSSTGLFAPVKSLLMLNPIRLCLYLLCSLAGLSSAWGGTPASIVAIYPPQININVGAHCAFNVSAAGTAPLSYQWSYNGTPIPGATNSFLALTNLLNANTISNAGTYTITVTNLATTNAGAAPAISNAVLTVYSGTYPLASSNLAVLRNGDGLSSPSASTGNTLYIDQIQTNGTYVSTLMIPDETNTSNFPNNSEIVAVSSTFMNQSANGLYLVFYGYNTGMPYSGGSVGSASAAAVPRAAGTVSGLGYYSLAATTSTSYNGDTLNDVASADGLTDFYFSASAGGCVLVQPGLPDVQITPSSSFGPGNGAGRQNGIYGGYLWFAANAALNPGLFTWNGTSESLPTNAGILPFDVVPNPATIASQNPNDFVFSPDGQTIYACSGSQVGGANVGGIQRWDNGTPYGLSGWTLTYNLTNIPEFGTSGNNGPDGIVVDFSGWTNGGGPGVWGAGSSNAIIYFTTGQQTNIMSIVDNNSANSTFSNPLANIIATLGPNQQWHGIRFCPSTLAASIVSQPSSATNAVPGSTVTFTVGSTGSQPLIYQWYGPSGLLSNGGDISGANSSTLTITGVSAANVGSYYVTVSNVPPTNQTSTMVTLALSTNNPAVAIPPANTTANYGGSATFTVVPYGTAPFTYQWQGPNGPITAGPSGTGSVYYIVTNFSSVTNCVLTISNVSCQDNGNYSVTVGDVHGSVTSTNGVLTVTDPIIITQPVSQFAFLNGTAVFSVTAAGTGTLGYQWLSNGVPMTDGGDISGSSTSTLTISPATSQNTANYSVVVSGTSGCNYGDTVTSTLAAFTAAFPPQSRTVTAGATVTFVAGGGTNFQWSYNGTNISGATNAFISFTNVQASSAGTYGISMNSGGLVANAVLTVAPGLFTLYPTNLIVFRQGDGVAGLANTGNIIYLDQYTTNGTYLNTTMIPYTGPSELLCNSGGTDGYMSMSANGQYLNFPGYVASRLSNTNSVSAATSTNIPRGIGAVNGLGYFVRPVSDTTLFSTGNINDACSSDGLSNFWAAGNITGLWYVRPGQPDVQIVSTANNPGTGNNKEVNIISGNLYCTDGSGTIGLFNLGPEPTSLISSNLSPIAIDASPNDFSISPDFQTIYITDGANVSPPGGFGGIERFDLVSGSYQLQYTIPTTTQPGQTGNDGPDGLLVDFSAHATWGAGVTGAIIYTTTGSTTENYLDRIVDDNGANSTATVLAFAGPNQGIRDVRFGPSVTVPVAISQQPANETNASGSTATFTVTATGTQPLLYQWTFDGTNIAGATNSSLVLSNVAVTNAGTYAVEVSNALPSSALSSNAVLTVIATGPSHFNSIESLSGGQVQLTFTGSAPGATYRLWGSTNVTLAPVTTTWGLLSSGTFGSGPVTYTDTGTNHYAARFYTITEP